MTKEQVGNYIIHQTIGLRKMIVAIFALIAICYVCSISKDGKVDFWTLLSIVSVALGQNLFQFFIDRKKI